MICGRKPKERGDACGALLNVCKLVHSFLTVLSAKNNNIVGIGDSPTRRSGGLDSTD